MEELNKLSEQLLRLETNRDWQTGDETCKIIARIFGIEVERFKLWHDPRIVAEATRFMTAFETVNNPASYESRHSSEKALDIKLFWMKKTSKTNLSWVVGSTCLTLGKRIAKHKQNFKSQQRKYSTTSYKIFDKYGIDSCEIVLIEDYPCENNIELTGREGYHIEKFKQFTKCVNINIPLIKDGKITSIKKGEPRYNKKLFVEFKVKFYTV